MSFEPPLAAVILAAGDSRRMGTAKALLATGQGTFLERVVAAAASLAPVLVVVGREAAAIREAHPHLGVGWVVNEHPAYGQLHSLRLALAALPAETAGAVVLLVDHPLVTAATVASLAAAWRRRPSAIAVPVYRGQRGHPVIFPRAVWGELFAVPLEAGARAVVLAEEGRLLPVAVDDPGVVADIDTPDAYRTLVPGASHG